MVIAAIRQIRADCGDLIGCSAVCVVGLRGRRGAASFPATCGAGVSVPVAHALRICGDTRARRRLTARLVLHAGSAKQQSDHSVSRRGQQSPGHGGVGESVPEARVFGAGAGSARAWRKRRDRDVRSSRSGRHFGVGRLAGEEQGIRLGFTGSELRSGHPFSSKRCNTKPDSALWSPRARISISAPSQTNGSRGCCHLVRNGWPCHLWSPA